MISNDLHNPNPASPTKDANYINQAIKSPSDQVLFQQNGSDANLIERQKLVTIDASEPLFKTTNSFYNSKLENEQKAQPDPDRKIRNTVTSNLIKNPSNGNTSTDVHSERYTNHNIPVQKRPAPVNTSFSKTDQNWSSTINTNFHPGRTSDSRGWVASQASEINSTQNVRGSGLRHYGDSNTTQGPSIPLKQNGGRRNVVYAEGVSPVKQLARTSDIILQARISPLTIRPGEKNYNVPSMGGELRSVRNSLSNQNLVTNKVSV
jgi:hypothetical protein